MKLSEIIEDEGVKTAIGDYSYMNTLGVENNIEEDKNTRQVAF